MRSSRRGQVGVFDSVSPSARVNTPSSSRTDVSTNEIRHAALQMNRRSAGKTHVAGRFRAEPIALVAPKLLENHISVIKQCLLPW